jgi:hypothetical protein
MRTTIILLSIATLLFSCSNQQSNNQNASQQQGRIKIETTFGFDAAEKENEPPKDTLTSKAVFKYDEKGNLVEANYYDLKTNSVFSKEMREYDDRGNMIEITFYNRNGEVNGRYTYKYDSLNNEIEKRTFWKGKFDGKVITAYDYEKMIVKVSFYKSDGVLQSSHSYKTDKKGNHVEDYDSDGNITAKSTITYDDKGNIIKEHSQAWEMDTTNHMVEIQYDKYNNEIIRTITDLNNNNQVSTRKIEFVYDKFGNWTKKVDTWSWLPDRQTTKREIEYYDK